MQINPVIVIPVYNEEDTVAQEVMAIRAEGFDSLLVGVDVATTDATERSLIETGTTFVRGVNSGYDGTVSAAVSAIPRFYPDATHVIFTDAGGKFPAQALHELIAAAQKGADLVMGARIMDRSQMLWHQKLGTSAILGLIRFMTGANIHDISPFRIISLPLLQSLSMRERRFGWPSQMLVKCLARKSRVVEIPVTVLRRKGTSKVSGSVTNSLRAGVDMFASLQYIRFWN